jgi:hypothetical protein
MPPSDGPVRWPLRHPRASDDKQTQLRNCNVSFLKRFHFCIFIASVAFFNGTDVIESEGAFV